MIKLNSKKRRRIVASILIFLAFLVALVFISPFLGMGIFNSVSGGEDYLKWFHLAFFMICSYALTCLSLWAGKVFKK